MNTALYVGQKLKELKAAGKPPMEIAWEIALACVGWAYVFGARGEYCDPSNRRARAREDHPTIQSSCKNFNGSDEVVGACATCKWYPGGRTRFFDCRGFTYWILKQVYGWTLQGAGATSQWNDNSNWKDKGEIATIPEDMLVCLFVKKGNTMEHTGFGFRGQTIECSVGVQHFTTRNRKWTHWAIPACIDEAPKPTPGTTKPTLRQGDSGPYVVEMQTDLMNRGYDIGGTGADGKFGRNTKSGLIAFQIANGLAADGICGPATWEALDQPIGGTTWTVHIPGLTKATAEAMIRAYKGATMTEEGGENDAGD